MPPKMADELAAEMYDERAHEKIVTHPLTHQYPNSSSSTEDESSQSSASSSVSESAQSNDVAVEAATKEKKRKTPSSTSRRSSGGARVKRIAPALDAEAAQRRDELRARTRDRLIDVLLPAVSEAVVAAMNAMLAGAATVGGAVSDSDARNVAVAVEACLFEQCGGVADNQYVGKARSLLFNLKTVDNAPLRISLVRGQITPLQLCNMSAKVTQIEPCYDVLIDCSTDSSRSFFLFPRTWLPLASPNRSSASSNNQCRSTSSPPKLRPRSSRKPTCMAISRSATRGARRVERAVDAEQRNGDAINDSVSLHASVEVRDAADAGFGDANDAATAPVEHAPTVSIGRIKSFEDFNDDGSLDGDATTNLDNVDEDDDAAALLDPESDVAHFGRRSSGGIDRVNSNADDVEPYTPPGTPPPLTPSDDEQEEAGVGKSSRPSVNAQTALFGVNIDMDNLRADGTLNCRGKLPLTVVRALSPKMSVVGRMEMDKCDSYLEALSTSSSRDRALCFVSASERRRARQAGAHCADSARALARRCGEACEIKSQFARVLSHPLERYRSVAIVSHSFSRRSCRS
jgi:hypothetical protein